MASFATAAAPPSPPSEASVIGALYGEPRGMTGTGSGDAARELLALEEAGDAAPPVIRNGTQERLRVGAGVGLGAGEGTGSGASSRRERESRRRLDAWEGVGDVNPGERGRDL